jgi:SET domain-containing protein
VAVVVGRTRAERTSRLRRFLAEGGTAAFVEKAYRTAGKVNALAATQRSGIAGRGVFARRAIARGTLVEDVTRPLVRYARVPKKGEPGYGHAIQIARGWWLLLTHSHLYYLNHRCVANVALRIKGATVRVVATKAIAKGEELTLDYATVAYRDDPYSFVCRCGHPKCRGVVRGKRR